MKWILFASLLTACGSEPRSTENKAADSSGDASGAPALLVQYPDKTLFNEQQTAQLTGIRLTISPVSKCEITAVNAVKPYDKSFSKEVLPVQCDFYVAVDIGTLSKDGKSISPVIFTNKISGAPYGAKILQSAINPSRDFVTNFSYQVTKDAQALGFGAGVITPQNPNKPSDEPNNSPQPTSAPNGNGVNLTTAQNVTLKNAAGTSVKLADTFGSSKYVVIDLSSSGCGYCVTLSKEINKSAATQKLLDGKTCNLVTMVPNGDLSAWHGLIPASTFAGSHSYSVTSSMSGVASAFKVNFPGTPTVFMIDRNGKVVASAVGQEPSEMASLCL